MQKETVFCRDNFARFETQSKKFRVNKVLSGSAACLRKLPAVSSIGLMARDDFPQAIRQALAYRAGHVCSMPECNRSTCGPSEETPESFTILGVAAHIAAASSGPGARRHDPEQSPAQRSAIENGIWLCCNCATMIDRDEATYTREVLRGIKRTHEANRSFGPRGQAPGATDDLIAFGSSIICSGTLNGAGPDGHRLTIKHFLKGEPSKLFAFINSFQTIPPDERFVLLNELGEGFYLRGAPTLDRDGPVWRLQVPLAPPAARTSVHKIGSSFAQGENGDWFVANGSLARVSGLAAFPRRLSNLLGLAKGEALFHRNAGSRVGEFFRDYAGSAWLNSLIKMEIIRLASIPAADDVLNQRLTPLQCVDRVRRVDIPASEPVKQPLPIRVALDLCGEGAWEGDIRLFVHTPKQLEKAGVMPEWLAASIPPTRG